MDTRGNLESGNILSDMPGYFEGNLLGFLLQWNKGKEKNDQIS